MERGRFAVGDSQAPRNVSGHEIADGFHHFCTGYDLALSNYAISEQNGLSVPREMHDWVAYKLDYKESTSGYAHIILKHHPSEDEALDVFFDLLDEYENRIPHTFAIIENINARYRTNQGGEETWHPYPSCIDLVTYGEHRGFFCFSA